MTEELKTSPFDFDGLTTSERSFPGDFHLENGNYMCLCIRCKQKFIGYKRRVYCNMCEVIIQDSVTNSYDI